MSEILLDVQNLTVQYQTDLETVHAVNHVSFALHKEETLGLVGETGAGKTTIALSLMRLLPQPVGRITDGRVLLQGQNIMELKDAEMRSLRGEVISMIFQDPMTSLNPVMPVGNQIKESLMLHASGQKDKASIDKRVDEILELVGIPASRKNEYPLQFSGGMRQRIVIAIALACEPDLLIADEPTTALDVTIQAQVLALMKQLKRRLQTAMIMITHDLGVVAQVCDNVAVIYAGEIVEYGTIEEIFTGEKHHPYTKGLFGSIPNISGERERRLTPIEGLMPDPTQLPQGCSFAPRCPWCSEQCITERPDDFTEGTHRIKCHLYQGGGAVADQQ